MCKFSLDEKQVVNYATTFVNNYQMLANIHNQTLEKYIEKNNKTENEFYQLCYEEAEDEVKSILIIGALAEQKQIEAEGTESTTEEQYAKIKETLLHEFGL